MYKKIRSDIMDQEKLRVTLNRLERKITLLLAAYHTTKKNLEAAQKEKKELQQKLKHKNSQLEDFKNQIKITKIAGSINPKNEDVLKLKKEIDNYIKKIDKCIAYTSH